MTNKKMLSEFPKIINKWHPILNNTLDVNKISYSSNIDAWFQCENNSSHVWKIKICELTRNNKETLVCPFCSGKKLTELNCLAAIYPDVAKEWHPTLNNETAYNVFPKATKTAFWQCLHHKDHVWKARIIHRTLDKSKCPFCAGRKLCKSNSLATVYPNIAKEWHPTLNNNLTPDHVISGSRQKVYWQCINENHVWFASISERVKNKGNGSGCPICKESRGEKAIGKHLLNKNIPYISQYQFKESEIPYHRFDFKVDSALFKGLIEFQGQQHYCPVDFGSRGNGLETLKTNIKNDFKKRTFCQRNKINLVYIPYWEIRNVNKILDDLLNGQQITISEPPKNVIKFKKLYTELYQSLCLI